MECSDIQKKLSAYLEGIIPSEEKGVIDEHLKACQKCNESLADLKKTLEYVQNLQEIEPPPWLTQKVMASVRSEAEAKRGIFQRLFHPLHIKLPIEALATILLAVATIYVFKTTQPEMKRTKELPAETIPRILVQEKEKTSALDETEPLPAKPAEEFMLAEEREIPAGKSLEAPEAPRVAKRDKVEPSAGALGKREYKRKALSPDFKGALIEKEEGALRLTINVKDIETAGREIEKAFVKLGGKIIKKEYFDQRNIIVAELDSKKVEDLFEKLTILGEVKEKALTLEGREGDIEIRIEVAEKQ
jgi:hypothetical protein